MKRQVRRPTPTCGSAAHLSAQVAVAHLSRLQSQAPTRQFCPAPPGTPDMVLDVVYWHGALRSLNNRHLFRFVFSALLGPRAHVRASGERRALIGTGRLLVRIDMDLPLGALTPHCDGQLDVASTNSAPPTSGGECFDWFLWNSDVACNALGAPDGEIQGAFPRTFGLWCP